MAVSILVNVLQGFLHAEGGNHVSGGTEQGVDFHSEQLGRSVSPPGRMRVSLQLGWHIDATESDADESKSKSEVRSLNGPWPSTCSNRRHGLDRV